MLMTKRLQVVMREGEIEDLRRAAEREGLTLSEWVRIVLRNARRNPSDPTPAQKIAALDRALRLGHPTADMDEMLADIENGRDLR